MKYLKVFTDFAKSIEPLGDAERGRLFTAMLEYAQRGTEPDFYGNERYIWPTAKLHIDREQEYSKKQAGNGKKGGRPKTQTNPPKPTKSQKSQKDKDKEKDKENNTPHTPQRGAGFDQFWTSYPKKVGKEAAKKAFDRVNVPVETLLAAIERQKCSDQWSRDNGRYIPNPATWLNQGRWEDELEQREEAGSGEQQERYFTLADLPGAVP